MLGVLEGQAVHVQRFSHDFGRGVGMAKSRCVVERVNKVGEGEGCSNAVKCLKCSERLQRNKTKDPMRVVVWL